MHTVGFKDDVSVLEKATNVCSMNVYPKEDNGSGGAQSSGATHEALRGIGIGTTTNLPVAGNSASTKLSRNADGERPSHGSRCNEVHLVLDGQRRQRDTTLWV